MPDNSSDRPTVFDLIGRLARREWRVTGTWVLLAVDARAMAPDPTERRAGLVLAVVEELLAGDLVAIDGVEADLFEGDAVARVLPRYVEGEVDGELVGAVEERAAHLLAVDRVVALPHLRLVDDRRLPGGLLSVALDGHDVGGVHRPHHVEVLALVAKVHKTAGDRLNTH